MCEVPRLEGSDSGGAQRDESKGQEGARPEKCRRGHTEGSGLYSQQDFQQEGLGTRSVLHTEEGRHTVSLWGSWEGRKRAHPAGSLRLSH